MRSVLVAVILTLPLFTAGCPVEQCASCCAFYTENCIIGTGVAQPQSALLEPTASTVPVGTRARAMAY